MYCAVGPFLLPWATGDRVISGLFLSHRFRKGPLMEGTALVVHRGARLVTRGELDRIEAPPPTETWFPIKHSDVLDTATKALADAGFTVSRTQLALSSSNSRFFGTL